MSVICQYTKDDYITAGRLHLKTPWRRNYVFWILLVATCFTVLIVPTLWYLPPALIAIELAFDALQNVIIVPISIKRQLNQNPTLFTAETTITFTDEGLSFKHDRGYLKIAWADIIRWKHNEHTILIYLTSRLYYMLPKRLDENNLRIDDVIEKLSQQVGSPY